MFGAEGEFGIVVDIQIKKDGAFKRLRGKLADHYRECILNCV